MPRTAKLSPQLSNPMSSTSKLDVIVFEAIRNAIESGYEDDMRNNDPRDVASDMLDNSGMVWDAASEEITNEGDSTNALLEVVEASIVRWRTQNPR
jgi:hypothetical protein